MGHQNTCIFNLIQRFPLQELLNKYFNRTERLLKFLFHHLCLWNTCLHSSTSACTVKLRSIITDNHNLVSIHFGCPPRNISECEFTGYIVPYSTPSIQATFPVSFSRSCMYADLASVFCFVIFSKTGKTDHDIRLPRYLESLCNSHKSLGKNTL